MPLITEKKGFKTHKELAAAYNVTPKTFSSYIKKAVPLLYAFKSLGKPGSKSYSPKEQKIIFDVLGEPA